MNCSLAREIEGMGKDLGPPVGLYFSQALFQTPSSRFFTVLVSFRWPEKFWDSMRVLRHEGRNEAGLLEP